MINSSEPTSNEIEQLLRDYLESEWNHFGEIIFSHSDGVGLFSQWIHSQRWIDSLPISPKESRKYAPAIICYSFREIRSRMIEKGLFMLRKKKLEMLLQSTLSSFPLEVYDSLLNENTGWSRLFTTTINAMEREFSITLPSIKANKSSHKAISSQDWLNSWLVRPHFPKYKHYYESIGDKGEQKFLETKAKNKLRVQAHHPHVKRVYFSLLAYHQCYEEGMDELFRSVSDPLHLTPEEKQFLDRLLQYHHPRLRSLLHHFIERLVERKTKQHYKEAIKYIIMLEEIYKREHLVERFHTYVKILKKRYERFSSFQKELAARVFP
ncbi:hypothetical protein J2S74_005457 [Evansella vedderi]|uniref:Uncharacterized protein n=1 Tax=Evansella vedderi TaxID=38282 RepID=A0ABU0A4G4_9BACI|nr:hypothetical protein [Evansella vedderi]MDQ0257994.1 hypothetical protein [Evansella vedderi]